MINKKEEYVARIDEAISRIDSDITGIIRHLNWVKSFVEGLKEEDDDNSNNRTVNPGPER